MLSLLFLGLRPFLMAMSTPPIIAPGLRCSLADSPQQRAYLSPSLHILTRYHRVTHMEIVGYYLNNNNDSQDPTDIVDPPTAWGS